MTVTAAQARRARKKARKAVAEIDAIYQMGERERIVRECPLYSPALSAIDSYHHRQSLRRQDGDRMDLDAQPDPGSGLAMALRFFQGIASQSMVLADG
jgi:hypothetical protein